MRSLKTISSWLPRWTSCLTARRRVLISLLALAVTFFLVACSPEEAPAPQLLLAIDTPLPSPTPTRLGAPDLAGESLPLPVACLADNLEEAAQSLRLHGFQDLLEHLNSLGGLYGAQLSLDLIEITPVEDEEGQPQLDPLPPLPLPLLFCDQASEALLAERLNPDDTFALGLAITNPEAYQAGSPLYSPNPLPESHLGFWLQTLAAEWPLLRPLGAGDRPRLALFTDRPGLAQTDFADPFAEQIDMVYTPSPEEALDVYAFTYAARDANVNAIFVHAEPTLAAELVNAVNALGLRERLPLLLTASSIGDDFQAHIFSSDYLANLLVSAPFPVWLTNEPGLAAELAGGNEAVDSANYATYFLALQQMDLAIYALQEALILVDPEELVADTLAAAAADLPPASDLLVFPAGQWLPDYQTYSQLRVFRFSEAGLSLELYLELESVPPFSIDLESEQ